MPEDNVYPPSPDFVTHAYVGGMEQYRDLYQRAGFELARVVDTAADVSVIEGRPR